MQLFTLMFGTSKRKMKPIMTDSKEKCEQYKKSRENSGNNSKAARGWHEIVPAENGADVWQQKTSTIGGNKDVITKTTGKNRGPHGYVGKHGFNSHT